MIHLMSEVTILSLFGANRITVSVSGVCFKTTTIFTNQPPFQRGYSGLRLRHNYQPAVRLPDDEFMKVSLEIEIGSRKSASAKSVNSRAKFPVLIFLTKHLHSTSTSFEQRRPMPGRCGGTFLL